ncbi:ACP S-malonyltransferase [Virgibacillus dokdonensis]|nr:ACP S-malonyltransferase [Virgibacillus dokdonensis]
MKSIAVVFPGQGSQYVGMGSDLVKEGNFSNRMEQVAEELGLSLKDLFALNTSDTTVMQPYIYGMSVALYELIQERYDIHPFIFAGHSLGEFSALTAAGSLSFEEGLKIVKTRSNLMHNSPKGTMIAIIGIEEKELEMICEEVSAETGGTVKIGNYNTSSQYVITGDTTSVYKVRDYIENQGRALRVKQLSVSGAFHSSLMEAANDEFNHAMSDVVIQKPSSTIVMNVDGELYDSPDKIKELLGLQMISSVQWKKSVETIFAERPELILEVGPGRTLAGIIKGVNRTQAIANVGNKQQLKQFSKQIRRLEVV